MLEALLREGRMERELEVVVLVGVIEERGVLENAQQNLFELLRVFDGEEGRFMEHGHGSTDFLLHFLLHHHGAGKAKGGAEDRKVVWVVNGLLVLGGVGGGVELGHCCSFVWG